MADNPEHESMEARPGIDSDEAMESAGQAGGEYDKLASELQEAKDKHLRASIAERNNRFGRNGVCFMMRAARELPRMWPHRAWRGIRVAMPRPTETE